jgi:hypothetical protein
MTAGAKVEMRVMAAKGQPEVCWRLDSDALQLPVRRRVARKRSHLSVHRKLKHLESRLCGWGAVSRSVS